MTQTSAGPRVGWHRGMISHRFVDEFDAAPISFDRASRSCDATLSRGSPVQRVFGIETLRISPSAVILDRVRSNGVPLLDSHRADTVSGSLGRVQSAWFDSGALVGKLKFNKTEQGEQAMGMVERGELNSLSCGYRIDAWLIRDEDGNEVDPEVDRVRWDDNLTFEATRWELREVSLVCVPADGSASIRSLGSGHHDDLADIRARMLSRTRMHVRQAMHDAAQAAMFGDRHD